MFEACDNTDSTPEPPSQWQAGYVVTTKPPGSPLALLVYTVVTVKFSKVRPVPIVKLWDLTF